MIIWAALPDFVRSSGAQLSDGRACSGPSRPVRRPAPRRESPCSVRPLSFCHCFQCELTSVFCSDPFHQRIAWNVRLAPFKCLGLHEGLVGGLVRFSLCSTSLLLIMFSYSKEGGWGLGRTEAMVGGGSCDAISFLCLFLSVSVGFRVLDVPIDVLSSLQRPSLCHFNRTLSGAT